MASIKLKGDTSGEVTISAPSVAGTTTLELPATSSTLATQNSLGVRNLIINGDMRIAQRGTSTSGQTSGGYTVDRFRTAFSGRDQAVWTDSQTTDVPSGEGFSNSFKVEMTTAETSMDTGTTEYFTVEHRMEGQHFQHLSYGTASAKKVTLSFWVKSSVTGTLAVSLYNADSTRIIGSTYTINATNTWEKKTITFDGDTVGTLDNDKDQSLGLRWFLGAADGLTSTDNTTWQSYVTTNFAYGHATNAIPETSGATWQITGVQLEVGDTATPFEHRPYDMELARCQRYYELINDNNYSSYGVMAGGTSQGFAGYVDYKITKRATPTITITGSFLIQGNSNQPGTTSMGTSGIGKRAVYINGTGTGSNVTNGFAYNLLDVNGYIKVDAEL